jgi:hypothetical protein
MESGYRPYGRGRPGLASFNRAAMGISYCPRQLSYQKSEPAVAMEFSQQKNSELVHSFVVLALLIYLQGTGKFQFNGMTRHLVTALVTSLYPPALLIAVAHI